MQQLITHGEVKRGALGIRLGDVSPDRAESLGLTKSRGALILDVTKGSPAERAGIKPGDIVISLNGVALDSAAQLRNAIELLRAGQTVGFGCCATERSARYRCRSSSKADRTQG